MGKVKLILTGIERYKDKIARCFIICAVIKFFSSTLYRIYSIQDSRTQLETIINVYSLFIIGAVFIHEFLKCLFLDVIKRNFGVFTHRQGQGFLFVLVSFIYMAKSLGVQQNYSAYLLFFVGIMLIISQFNFADQSQENDPFKRVIEECKNEKNLQEVKIDVVDMNENSDRKEVAAASNPYDIPEDF